MILEVPVLTSADIAAVLAEFRYKPGWTFRLVEGHPEGPRLNVRFDVVDAYHPEQVQTQSVDTFIPPCNKPSDLVAWLVYRLRRIEIHECDEFARWRGELVRDPHSTWCS